MKSWKLLVLLAAFNLTAVASAIYVYQGTEVHADESPPTVEYAILDAIEPIAVNVIETADRVTPSPYVIVDEGLSEPVFIKASEKPPQTTITTGARTNEAAIESQQATPKHAIPYSKRYSMLY